MNMLEVHRATKQLTTTRPRPSSEYAHVKEICLRTAFPVLISDLYARQTDRPTVKDAPSLG